MVNPLGAISSTAMLLRRSLGVTVEDEAVVECAFSAAPASGARTVAPALGGATSIVELGETVRGRFERQLDHLVEGGLTVG